MEFSVVELVVWLQKAFNPKIFTFSQEFLFVGSIRKKIYIATARKQWFPKKEDLAPTVFFRLVSFLSCSFELWADLKTKITEPGFLAMLSGSERRFSFFFHFQFLENTTYARAHSNEKKNPNPCQLLSAVKLQGGSGRFRHIASLFCSVGLIQHFYAQVMNNQTQWLLKLFFASLWDWQLSNNKYVFRENKVVMQPKKKQFHQNQHHVISQRNPSVPSKQACRIYVRWN